MYTGQVGITRTYVEMAWRLCVTEGRISRLLPPLDGCSRIECIMATMSPCHEARKIGRELYKLVQQSTYRGKSTCTAKTKYRNFDTNIPRKGILGSQSQFPHSCVCEGFILYISTIGLPILLEEICRPILGL